MSEENENSDQQADIDLAIRAMLKNMPGGFSVAPDGAVTEDRVAVDVKSVEELSKLVRQPVPVTFDLQGGNRVRFMIRPLDAIETREIDDLNANAPIPPFKETTRSPSLAIGKPQDKAPAEYNFADPEYRKKVVRHAALRRAIVISKGLCDIKIEGQTAEQKAEFLEKNFTARILDGIEAAINGLSSDPIERALFT